MPLDQEPQQDFCIALRLEHRPISRQLLAEALVVVDFAVVGERMGLPAEFERHRLMSAFEVNDGQTAMAQQDATPTPESGTVWPTMRHGRCHIL
jgi:hypothetical protein